MLQLKRCVWVLKEMFHELKRGQLDIVTFHHQYTTWCMTYALNTRIVRDFGFGFLLQVGDTGLPVTGDGPT